MATGFSLQFHEAEIPALASRYQYQGAEGLGDFGGLTLGQALSPEQLLVLAKWKSPRSAHHVLRNSAIDIEEATRVAFEVKSERIRIGSLLALDGVAWPMASVILHFGHREPYPILDFRALEALGVGKPAAYTFDFWNAYVGACRALADSTSMSMRTLDRALWQWSKERPSRKP